MHDAGADGADQEDRGMVKRKYEPQERYDAKNAKHISLKLNKNTDADILEHLEKRENVQGYIKSLIRADINE